MSASLIQEVDCCKMMDSQTNREEENVGVQLDTILLAQIREVARPSGSQSLFKAKRMEFPKFSGDMRAYNTFRRDFREIVERDAVLPGDTVDTSSESAEESC